MFLPTRGQKSVLGIGGQKLVLAIGGQKLVLGIEPLTVQSLDRIPSQVSSHLSQSHKIGKIIDILLRTI